MELPDLDPATCRRTNLRLMRRSNAPMLVALLADANAVAQGATDGGAFAVAEAYHAALVAPFCAAAVKSFFASQ
jgi:hypothetical protein